MQNVAIIGYGRFGKTLHRLLKDDFHILVLDHSKVRQHDLVAKGNIINNLEEIYKKAEVVFYCVPISAFEKVISEHKNYFDEKHLLIDVLSVKVHPKRVFKKYLKGTRVQAMLTHPMFGPDSSKNGFENLPIVLDRFKTNVVNYSYWKKFFIKKGLRVVEISAEKHDKLAADSQGVTFFLGRLLKDFGMSPTPIDTLGAKKLQEVMEQTCNDTWELFSDLQSFNPYTKNMRLKIGKSYDKLYEKLLPKRTDSRNVVFGIQGGKGSFNEQALEEYIKRHKIKNYKVEYLYTTERVLQKLHEGKVDYGQFAMHNSIGGIVSESVYAMAKHKFRIVEEFAIIISHYLMKRKDVEAERIDTIMTHPQVLKQCQSNLAKRYPEMKLKIGKGDLIDHAVVAREMAKGKIAFNIAVMGPKILSEIYDLDIIDTNLQDSKENFTSFLMVSR